MSIDIIMNWVHFALYTNIEVRIALMIGRRIGVRLLLIIYDLPEFINNYW